MNNRSLLGITLILIGGLLVLKFFNINIGAIFGFLIPFILIGCGAYGLMNGKKVFGGIFLVLGIILLLSKFSGIITFILAVLLIGYGVSLFKGSNRSKY